MPNAPTALLFSESQKQALEDSRRQIAALEEKIALNKEREQPAFEAWLAQAEKISEIPDLIGLFHCDASGSTLSNQALGEKINGTAPGTIVAPGIHQNALVLGQGNIASFESSVPFQARRSWTISFWARILDLDASVSLLECKDANQGTGRMFFDYKPGRLTAGWERDGPSQSLVIEIPFDTEAAHSWNHLTLSCNGSNTAEGLTLYLNGEPTSATIKSDKLSTPAIPNDPVPLLTFGVSKTGNILLDELHLYDRCLTAIEIQHLKAQEGLWQTLQEPQENHAALTDYYFSSISPSTRAIRQALEEARTKENQLLSQIIEIPVLKNDGNSSTPQKIFTNLFPPSHAPSLSNRLELAQWLTGPDHPLTARVFVNRVWSHFFGAGLVADEFGLRASHVSQPELLDWLARDFVDNGWDLKRLCRTIVQSSTYRQSRLHPHPLPRRTAHDILLSVTGTLETPPIRGLGSSEEPWRYHFLSRQPKLTHDWRLTSDSKNSMLSSELFSSSAQHLAHELLKSGLEDDRARMRALFLRLRGQDETHPEFTILLELLEIQKKSFEDQTTGNRELLLEPEIPDGLDIEPSHWAAWLDICSSLLEDPNLFIRK